MTLGHTLAYYSTRHGGAGDQMKEPEMARTAHASDVRSANADRIFDELCSARIVPVVVIDDPSMALDLASALAAGGIHCAEITLRTDAGLASITEIAGIDGFVIGAGTVVTTEQVDACADAGAQFIVSPGLDEYVVERAQEHGLFVLPGVATATELQSAMRAGLRAVKFFPANILGGLTAISALSAPFPDVRFMPSGGVGPDNVVQYLSHSAVFAVGGSWMVPRATIAARDTGTLAQLSAEALALLSP